MAGHQPFKELTKNHSPEHKRRIKEMVADMEAAMVVLTKLKDAFPDLYKENESNLSFGFEKCGYRGATLYFRKNYSATNQARIHSGRVKNFPNGDRLKDYLVKHKIPVDPSASHPDYLIGPEHVDKVIALLKEGLADGPNTEKELAAPGIPVIIATEVTG